MEKINNKTTKKHIILGVLEVKCHKYKKPKPKKHPKQPTPHKTTNTVLGLLVLKCGKYEQSKPPKLTKNQKHQYLGPFWVFDISSPRIQFFFVFLAFSTLHLQEYHYVYIHICIFLHFQHFTSKNPIFCIFLICFVASLVPKVLNILCLLAFCFSAFPTLRKIRNSDFRNARCVNS